MATAAVPSSSKPLATIFPEHDPLIIPALAIWLADLRYCVVPHAPGTKKPMWELLPIDSRTGRHKVAGLLRRPLTADGVRGIAATRPGLNWSLHQRDTGLVVLDMDDVAAFTARGWTVPTTPTVSTHRGLQFWLALGRRSFWKASYKIIADGRRIGEFLTDGQRMLPGSIHPEGTLYAWMPGMAFGQAPVAPVPEWLLQLIEAPEHGRGTSRRTVSDNSTSRTRSPEVSTHSTSGGRQGAGRALTYESHNTTSRSVWSSLDLTRAFRDEEVARRLMLKAAVEDWPGIDMAFHCPLPGHRHADLNPSASIWRNENGELRYRCFAGHHGQEAWSLVHVFAFLVTGQQAVLAKRRQTPVGPQGGLGKGAVKTWAARMLVELGFAPSLTNDLLDPSGVPDGTLRVWRGFKRLLCIQGLYDTSAIYCAPYSVAFAAMWSDIPFATAQRALKWLTDNSFLRIVAVLPSRVRVLVAGPAAFPEGYVIDWWKDAPPPVWPSGSRLSQ